MDPAVLPTDLIGRAFTTSEALSLGLTRKRLRAQDLWTPTYGVRAGSLPTRLTERLGAYVAAARGDFAFSHVTAAQLLGIPVPLALEDDGLVHIVTTTAANRTRRAEVRGHRGLESRRVVEVAGLPVVAPPDTWVDLGEYVGPGRPVGLDDLICAADAVVDRLGGTTPLLRAVERRVRPRGKVTLTYALPRVRGGARSAMETRCRLMVTRAGLPEPEMNVDLNGWAGEWLGVGDLVWRRQRVVGEYQGVEFHTRPDDVSRDELRRSLLEREGWTVVDIVADDVFDPALRALKLRELAVALGVSPHVIDVAAAAPQFFAPAQFPQPRRPRPT